MSITLGVWLTVMEGGNLWDWDWEGPDPRLPATAKRRLSVGLFYVRSALGQVITKTGTFVTTWLVKFRNPETDQQSLNSPILKPRPATARVPR